MPTQFIDTFESMPASSWQIDEAADDKVVDGINILARARGPFFLVNGSSRNNRYYSKGLWEKAIERSKASRENGAMLGTIGHDTELDDKALMEGKASHRVTKLWIDEKTNVGMGEVLVLNTPAGRNLNGYLRGGVRFPVSSRATGEYTGRKINGANELDAETYNLERFDFVRTPGVETAVPSLVESTTKPLTDTLRGDATMPGEMNAQMLEQLTRDKIAVQSELDSVLASRKELEGKLAVAKDRQEHAERLNKDLTAKVEELESKLAETAASNAAYESLGDAALLDSVSKEHAELKEILEGFDAHELVATVGALEPLGTVAEIRTVLEAVAALSEAHGTLAEIEEKLNFLSNVEVTDIVDALQRLEKFEELGTLEEVQEALNLAMSVAEKVESDRIDAQIAKLVSETGVSTEAASTVLQKMDMQYDDAKKFILEMSKKSNDGERFRVPTRSTAVEENSTEESSDDEVSDLPQALNENRALRLFTQSGRTK